MPVIYVCNFANVMGNQVNYLFMFMVRTEEGFALYLYTKLKAGSSIRSKIIRGLKISK